MNTKNQKAAPIAAIDALGRRLIMPGRAPKKRAGRYVGMFYFVNLQWEGRALGDNTEIWNRTPEAFQDPDHPVWDCGACYWGKPLFGYYAHDDEWVIRRHVMMLMQADIDFIVFDTTNLSMHAEVSQKVLSILEEFREAGWDAPQAVYYTNSESGKRVREIYDAVYKPGKFRGSWFMWEGKPLIIGRPEQCDDETRSFFTFRLSQWPTEARHETGGFPWIAFERPQPVFLAADGKPETVSVSVAQHPQIRFGDSAFHGEQANWGRSYHTTFYKSGNDKNSGAVRYGYNIAEQWERAIVADPQIVFVTGWNEWVAGVMKCRGSRRPVTFVDTASQEFSRDIEPMAGGHLDNYYMQLIDQVRRFKGVEDTAEASDKTSIDIAGGFGQWDGVTPAYRGFPFFDIPRNHTGMDGQQYTSDGGCNTFDVMKLARDDKYLYIYVKCFRDIAPYDFTNRMNLLLRVQRAGGEYDAADWPDWEGYHFLLNHEGMDRDYTFLCESLGGWRWKPAATVLRREEGSELHAAIPLDSLRLAGSEHFEVWFKWADRLEELEAVEDFYLNGCTAPYGRGSFIYKV